MNDVPVVRQNRDHPLTGDWVGYRECHIQSDWLLVYLIENGVLVLAQARTAICLVNEMLCKIAGICVEGVTICHPLVLSVVFLPPISGILRPGKLIGGLADFLHFLSRSTLSSVAI